MDFEQYLRDRLPPLALSREPEIVAELAQHLSDLYAEARAAGLSHEDALARAAAALPEQPDDLARAIRSASQALPAVIVERWRSVPADADHAPSGGWSMLSDLRRDLQYAIRTIVRTPAMAAVVVITFALGIGANAAIFSAVDAVLLRSAPVTDPDRLVSVYTTAGEGASGFSGASGLSASSNPDYRDLAASGALDGLAAYAGIPLTLDAGGTTEALTAEVVSGNYFDVLGVRLPLGRGFAPDEDRAGAPVRVIVLADALWRTRFNADREAVGRVVTINGNPYTVIGVAPRDFTGPIVGRAADAWVPLALQQEVRPPSAGLRRALGHSNLLDARGPRWLNMIGRLREGATIKQTAAALDAVSRRLEADNPSTNRGRYSVVLPLGEGPGLRVSARPMLRLLGGAVSMVLLIACANVASLLLARAVSRRREVAVRVAIGAGRGRLVRQWLTEVVLLALLGAAGGVLIASSTAPLLHLLGIPETIDLGLNARVFAFALGIGVMAGLVAALAPIVQTLRRDTMTALRDEGGAVATGVRASRMRAAFVTLQVALSLVLLVGAGLFLRTLQNAYAVDLGYGLDNVLLADINLDVRGYSQDAGQAVYSRILETVETLPGVVAAGAARVTVLSGAARTTSIAVDGRPLADDGSNGIEVRVNVVSRRYLDVLRIPVIRGRNFAESDHAKAPRVAIVSQSLAQRLWHDADPIGRRFGSTPVEVIGVVPDAVYRSALERNPPPFFYLPLEQNYESGVTLHIQTDGDPRVVLPAVRHSIRSIDPQLVVNRPRTLRAEFTRSIADQRMMATIVGSFGALALFLAAVGLYGTLSHMARQRMTEIGIRLALGARPASILRMVVAHGLRLTILGAALGLAGALAAVRSLQNQLFGVQPTDPVTFIAMCAVLVVAAVLACVIPAWRAMRVDPVVALRNVE